MANNYGGPYPATQYQNPQRNGSAYSKRPPMTSTQAPTTNNAQYLNNSNFSTNAQISSPGLPLTGVPPPPFPFDPALLKQLAHSTLPPPPPPTYPPLPILNLSFSPFQNPQPTSQTFSPGFTQTSATQPELHNDAASYTQNIHQPVPQLVAPPIVPTLEEGELSEGELNDSAASSSHTLSNEGTTKTHREPIKSSTVTGNFPLQQAPADPGRDEHIREDSASCRDQSHV